MAAKTYRALKRFEHDGLVSEPGATFRMPYGSEQEREYADLLVRTQVIEEVPAGASKTGPVRKKRRER